MGLISFGKKKLQDRVEDTVERWRPARTRAGNDIGSIEAIYTVAVFVAALLLVSIAPRVAMAQLLIFGAAVVALSAQVKRRTIPSLYGMLAPRFGWADFEVALKTETDAREATRVSKLEVQDAPALKAPEKVAEAAAPAQGPNEIVKSILAAYVCKSKGERQSFTARVLAILAQHGINFESELKDADGDEERQVIADLALRRLAKQHGIAGSAA